jgi:hypothetical protein
MFKKLGVNYHVYSNNSLKQMLKILKLSQIKKNSRLFAPVVG